MKFTLSYSANDYIQSYLYDWFYSKEYKRAKRNFILSRFILVILFTGLVSFKDPAAGAVVFIMWGAYNVWFYKKGFKEKYFKYYSKHVNNKMQFFLERPIEFELRTDSILTSDETCETKLFSSSFDRFIETANYYFIELQSKTKLIFPKDQIENISDFEAAVGLWELPITQDLDWEWNKP